MDFIRSIYLCLGMTLLAGIAVGQDLESAWQVYLNTNNRITVLREQQQLFLEEQHQVNAESVRLKKSASWYNAWLNKWLLSSYANRQLELADSLQVVSANLTLLINSLAKDQIQLLQAYESLLVSVDDAGALSSRDQETTLRVGRWLSSLPENEISLPDYEHLVEEQYANPEIRHLVLSDVQILLMKKIVQLDSLLVERTREERLTNRLAAFHEDLGLQMEVEQDVQERDQDGTPRSFSAWGGVAALNESADDRYDAQTGSPIGANENRMDDAVTLSGRRSALQSGSANPQSRANSDYLETRRNEYQQLLLAIEMELKPAP